MLYWLLALVAVLGVAVWYVRNWLREPPGAPPLVKFDGSRFNALKLVKSDPVTLITEARKLYGDVFTLDMLFFKQVVITEYDGLEWLYGSKDDTLSFYESIKIFLYAILGDESVKERPEHEHLERANKVAAIITRHKKTFFQHIEEEVSEWAAALAAKGEPFDFYEEADNLITNINIHCFIGKEMRSKYAKTFKVLYDELELKGFTLGSILIPWLPLIGDGARCKQIRKQLSDILEPIIIERKKRFEETGEQQVDYLNEYIVSTHKHNKQPWSLAEMIERTLAIFFAARVNTLRTFVWTTVNIAAREAVVDRLRQEIDEKEFTFETIKACKYIDNCMKESVRPVYNILAGSRIAMKPLQYKGYTIPKGYAVAISAYLVNHDPTIFPEPEKFEPDRWAKDGSLNSHDQKVKHCWTFFGNGSHRCKGEEFAYITMRTTLAYLFKNYDLKWVDQKEDGQIPEYQLGSGLPYPKAPVMVTLTPRKPSA